MTTRTDELVAWLRAVGEPSRLRLLALCALRDLSVSDLAEALGQSEPRVSRHLRILSEAGLVERLRQGQWVHYRITESAGAATFVRGLLAQLDRSDPLLVRDRERARPAGVPGSPGAGAEWGDSRATNRVGAGEGGAEAARGHVVQAGERIPGVAAGSGARGGAARPAERAGSLAGVAKSFESRLGRALKGFVEGSDGAAHLESALVVGVEHLELLESAASIASHCTAIAHSRRAAQSARAFAERRGFGCRVLLAATPEVLCERDLINAGQTFDAVLLDHLAAPDSQFGAMLTYGRRALAPGGRLWLFERYEALAHASSGLAHASSGLAHGSSGLEGSRDRVVEHPLARLRRLLGDVGLTCERLSPIEADGEHVLAALAVPAIASPRGTVQVA